MGQPRDQIRQTKRQRARYVRQGYDQQTTPIENTVVEVENRFFPIRLASNHLQIIQTNNGMGFKACQRFRTKWQQFVNADAYPCPTQLLDFMAGRLQQMAFTGVRVTTNHHDRQVMRVQTQSLKAAGYRLVSVTVKIIEPGVIPEFNAQDHL